MKSGASDPFSDSEDDEDERSESSAGRAAESSETAEPSWDDGNREAVSGPPRDERSESSESGTESEANRERGDDDDERSESPDSQTVEPRDDAEADPAIEGGAESEGRADAAEGDGPLSRDELPLVLRRDRVKDERPEVHQLFVQQETHDRAVEAERALEDRMNVDLSRTDAREAIYLAGMAHLDDAEEILREWGYDL